MLLVAISCASNTNDVIKFTYDGDTIIIKDVVKEELCCFIIDPTLDTSLISRSYYMDNYRDFKYAQGLEMQFGVSNSLDYRLPTKLRYRTPLGVGTFIIGDIKNSSENVIGIIGSDLLENNFIIDYENKQLVKCN